MAELLFVIPVAAGLDAVVVKRLILAGIGTGTKAGDDIIVGGVYQIIVKRSLQAGEIMAVGVAFYEIMWRLSISLIRSTAVWMMRLKTG